VFPHLRDRREALSVEGVAAKRVSLQTALVMHADGNLRAFSRDRNIAPESVERYPRNNFGDAANNAGRDMFPSA
jgi:hypothetical protein